VVGLVGEPDRSSRKWRVLKSVRWWEVRAFPLLGDASRAAIEVAAAFERDGEGDRLVNQ
jgi:hypothetical protein